MPTVFTKLAAAIWRDFNTEDTPASGKYSPRKGDIRVWGTEIEDAIGDIETDIGGIETEVDTLQTEVYPVSRGGTGQTSIASLQASFKIAPFDGTATISAIWTFTAQPVFDAGAKWNDNDAATFGTGNDFTIAHNGTNTVLSNATGGLFIDSFNGIFLRSPSGDVQIEITTNGAVILAHDGNDKVTTTAIGATVTGRISADTIGGEMVSTNITSDTGNTTKVPRVAAVETYVNARLAGRYSITGRIITLGGTLTIAHGLGAVPSFVELSATCVTGEHGYTSGQVIYLSGGRDNDGASGSVGTIVYADATNVYVRFGSAQWNQTFNISTGALVSLTAANWTLNVRAY